MQRKINRSLDCLKPDILLPSVLPANWWAFSYKRTRKNVFCLWYCHEPSAFIHSPEWIEAIEDRLMHQAAKRLNPWLKDLDRWLVRGNVDYVICNSRFTQGQFQRTYGIESQGHIYPGVDLDRFTPAGDKSEDLFMVSRLTRFKNIRVALEALALLKRKDRRLLIGGEGEAKEDLRRLTNSLGLDDRVIFLGSIPHDRLPSLYARAKLLIFTTEKEPFGMVPVEALACGTPVIASNSGGVQETVQHGVNGLLLDPMTPRSLSEGIDHLLENTETYDFLRQNTRKSVERFCWDHHVQQFREILDQIIQERRTRRGAANFS